MNNFKERKQEFEKRLEALMDKYGVRLYPVNSVMQNGEVVPVVKILDVKNKEVEDEDRTKE